MTYHRGIARIISILIIVGVIVGVMFFLYRKAEAPTGTDTATSMATSTTQLAPSNRDEEIAGVRKHLEAIWTLDKAYWERSKHDYSNICTERSVLENMNKAANVSKQPVTCNTALNSWTIQIPLKTGGYWCVDSNRTSKETSTALGSTHLCS